MIKENKDILNVESQIKILYYGSLNYINTETNEKRFFLTGATDDPNLVGFLLNQKLQEDNIKFLDFDIECMPYEDDMFSTLAEEDIFVNENNFLQNHSSKNIHTDKDKICLFEIVKEVPKTIKRKNFKTEEKFVEAVNKKSTILVNRLDSTIIIEDFERLSKSTFFSCPIVNSSDYKNEIIDFLNSDCYSYFEQSISIAIGLKDCLSSIIDDFNTEYNQQDSDVILETVLKPLLGEKWKEQLNLLKYFIDRTDLKLTVSSIELNEIGEFGQDNKNKLFEFIEYCLMKAENHKIDKLTFSVIVRQFTDIFIEKTIPEKYVGACVLNEHGIFPLSKKDIMMASLICAETGKKLKKEKTVTYMSFNNLFQELKNSENKMVR